MEAHNYSVNVTWNEGRIGTLMSDELHDKVRVATPPQFPGGIEGVWSPEHLFTAAVSSCFMTTFLSIAEKSRLTYNRFSCNATGVLDQVDAKLMMTEVYLSATIEISNEADKEKAESVLEKAERFCLISDSIKSKVYLQYNINIAEHA